MPGYQQANGTSFSLTYRRAGRIRTIAFDRGVALGAIACVVAAVIWSVASGFYIAFHDRLLASLMSRQAEIQYAYEDQLETLRMQLDRESSGKLIDRRIIDTTLRDLTFRSDRLAARAATVDKLLADTQTSAHDDRWTDAKDRSNTDRSNTDRPNADSPPKAEVGNNPLAGGSAPAKLRLHDANAESSIDALDAGLADIASKQTAAVERLRDPLVRETRRIAAALAETGLSRRVLGGDGEGVGGPFVPLPANASTHEDFDTQVALLRDALVQHDRLTKAADRVPLRMPLAGPLEVTSSFGPRIDPFLGRPALHTGIDLGDSTEDAVYATASGVITVAGPSGGYGNMVEIDHGNGLVTRYAHLAAVLGVAHQRVAAGAIVGRVGASGRATGPHLHYEIRIDGEPVDPATILAVAKRYAAAD